MTTVHMEDVGAAWLSLGWASALTALLLLALGFPLARILGLRGFASVAVAPAFAVTVICGASVVLGWLDVPWSPLGVVVIAAVLGAVLAAVRRFSGPLRPERSPRGRLDVPLCVALVLAAAVITWRLVSVIQTPDAISQTFDNVFHLNAVRWILDTGSASAFEIGYMTNPEGPPTFYPSGWHGVVTLVAQMSGASVPVAINGVVLAISAFVWPLGIVLLTRTLFGRSPAVSIAAGLVAASVPGFPLLLMDYGVLYPFQLGVALLPVALTATVRLLGLGAESVRPGVLWWAISLAGVLPGIALVHPGAFMAWLALSAPMAVVYVITRWRRTAGRRARVILIGGFAAYLVVGAALVYVLRPPAGARGWQPVMSTGDALVKLLTATPWYANASILVAIAVAAGFVYALTSRSRPGFVAVGMYVVAAVLFIVVAAVPFPYRDLFTAPWYNNVPRIAAVLTVTFVPLGAYGLARAWEAVRRMLRTRGAPTRVVQVSGAACAAAVLILLQVGPFTAMPESQRAASASFALTDDSPLLSSDEAALLSRLEERVPEDVAVAGSPWTGTSVAYALTGRHVLMPHIQMEISDDLETVNEELADAAPGSSVCDAVDALDVGFVLDFGTKEVHGANHVFPGLTGLDESDAVRLVDRQGDARLYEVVGCGR